MTKPMLKFKSSRLVVMAAVAAISLTACSSLFTAESRFDPVKLTSYEQTAQGSIVWSQSIGSSGDYGFAPIVVGEDVFAATPNGNVARLGLANGAVRWNTKVPTALSAGVGTDGQIVVVTTRDGRLIALDANNGNQLWETRTSTVSTTPPVVGANMVVVRNDDYRVQGFDRQSGELQWSYMRSSAPLALKTNTRMVVANNIVYASVPIGRLLALNIDNGRPIWDIRVGAAKGATDLDSVIDVVGLPVQLADNSYCTASYQGAVLCYYSGGAQSEPQLKWTRNFSTSVGLGAAQNTLYASGMHGEVTAFDGNSGEILWQDNVLRNRGLTTPVYFNNKVYVGDYEGYVHFYDHNSGELQGRMSVGDSREIRSELIATPYGVLVQTGSGRLVMLGAQ
ncbi:MAG: outer membrane protein assembly factor BamB [Alcaligenaceae bacterium]|nr:outer membrane protein assembly factor BamB [Alcaligenaceae bacterium]